MLKEHAEEARQQRVAFEQRFEPGYPTGGFDFTPATPSQLDTYLALLIDERVRGEEYLTYLQRMHGGGEAFIRGERELYKIREAEESAVAPTGR